MLSDLLKLAWGSLANRKGRTALAIIGISVAFVALTAALSIGETFKVAISSFFQRLGLNTVWVFPQGMPFTDADVELVRVVGGALVKAVVPIASDTGILKLPDGSSTGVYVYYLPPEAVSLIIPPDALESGDLLAIGSSALASNQLTTYDKRPLLPGVPVELETQFQTLELTVSGVYDARGLAVPLAPRSLMVDASLKPASLEGYQVIFAIAEDERAAARLAESLKRYFPDSSVFSPQTLAKQFSRVATAAELGLGALAGIGVLITAMWLYDTMTMAILQRTKEFGIMRAVGYKRRHIFAMVLAEVFISTAIGILAASPLVLLIANIPLALAPGVFLKLSTTPDVIAKSLAVVTIANILGVLPPAYRASKLSVVGALRYE